MQAVAYESPTTVEEAVALLARHGAAARILSGGTDLIVQTREGRRALSVFVDAKAIPETTAISWQPDGGLRVGAATPCAHIYEDAEVARRYPALIDAASLIGGIQIQSRASLGGNLCNSSPAADSVPAMIALRARCEIAGSNGRREIPVEQFITGPGRNVLAPEELLVSLSFPAPEPRSGAAYQRFIPRNEMDIAVCSAGVSLTVAEDGRTIRSARVALGAVAPTALLVEAAAAALVGQPLGEEAFRAAATAAATAAQPITDMRGSIAQRRHLAGVLTRRVLVQAAARIPGI